MKQAEILAVSLDNPVFVWVAGLFTCQIVTQIIASKLGPFKSNPSLLAHQVCSFAAILFTGGFGIYYWYGEAATVQDRLYDKMEGGPVVAQVNLAFQVYDLVATLCIADLRKFEMIVHHSLAILLAFFLLRDEYAHYYAVFFLGMTEASSIPLCIVDVFKHFKKVAAQYDTLNGQLRILFALAFIGIRVIYWPCVSFRYFKDTYASIQDGSCHDRRLAMFFASSNALLTLLQWYWGYLIIKAAAKMLKKDKKAADASTNTTKKVA